VRRTVAAVVPAPRLLLLLDDVRVQLGPVLRDGVLVVVVDRDLDDLRAPRLVRGVVELRDEGVYRLRAIAMVPVRQTDTKLTSPIGWCAMN